MAWRGGNYVPGSSSAAAGELIAKAVKAAQRPQGLVIPPGAHNDSMYGATGEWVPDHFPNTVKLPAFKFTIKQHRGGGTRSLRLTVSDPSFPIYSTAGALHHHAQSYRQGYVHAAVEVLGHDNWNRLDRGRGGFSTFTAQWTKVKADIEAIAHSYNYDKSDMQSDYFDTGFYFEVMPHAELQKKSYETSERLLSALEAAFPDRWQRILVMAAAEEVDAAGHDADPRQHPNDVSTRFRSELDRDLRRALENIREGAIVVPFNPERRGWHLRYQIKGPNKGKPDHYQIQKKLKVGMFFGFAGAEPGEWVTGPSVRVGETIGPADYEWMVMKATGGRGGTYREQTLMGRGLAPSVEGAVRAAEAVMGIHDAPTGDAP